MNKFPSAILIFSCFSLLASEPCDYLQWDNTSSASVEDLFQDPLLILRTADRNCASENALPLAWKRLSEWDYLNNEESHPSLNSQADTNKQYVKGNIQVATFNASQVDHSTPTFLCSSQDLWENLHWQICHTPDFSQVISTLDTIDPYSSSITISKFGETFLDSDKTYFLRARGVSGTCCSEWSETVTFSIHKPATPENITINSSSLAWEGPQNSDTTYLIFGSNSIDFIPSIYIPYKIDAMDGDKITAVSLEDNFLGETNHTSWPLNNHYAYYRVLAKFKGHLSSPSSLIYDYNLSAQRDILCSTSKGLKNSTSTAYRQPLPSTYAWLQEHTKAGFLKYVQNPHVSEYVWDLLKDYFLPENHPAKPVLDKIFKKHHVLSSRTTFKKAGFDLLKHPQNRMIIAKHSKLKGYLVKAFLDAEPNTEWEWWKKRIDGARIIQNSIDKHNYHPFMKVPKKWIYPLPPREDSSHEKGKQKQFVLIVENMHLESSQEIRRSFKTKVTRELLDALYVVITENLLIDSIFADNIPFSKDGKIAFVDTEHFNDTTQPVRLWMLARYLSPEMHAYWDQVLFHGRPLTLPADSF